MVRPARTLSTRRTSSVPGLPTHFRATLAFCYDVSILNHYCAWTPEYNVVKPMDALLRATFASVYDKITENYKKKMILE